MAKIKSNAHAVKKARKGSIKRRKTKENLKVFSSKTVKTTNSFKSSSDKVDDLVIKSKMILFSIFEHSAPAVFNYIDERVRIDSQNQPANGIRLNYPGLDKSTFSNATSFGKEIGDRAISNYYNVSILNAVKNSEIKSMMSMAFEKGINALYFDLLPKESDSEIYDFLNNALKTLLGKNYLDAKNLIERAPVKKNFEESLFLFNGHERSILEAYTNDEYSFDIQVYCFNMYRNYLIFKSISNDALDHVFKIKFGFEWEKFKKQLQLELKDNCQG